MMGIVIAAGYSKTALTASRLRHWIATWSMVSPSALIITRCCVRHRPLGPKFVDAHSAAHCAPGRLLPKDWRIIRPNMMLRRNKDTPQGKYQGLLAGSVNTA